MQLPEILQLVKKDFDLVNQTIIEALHTKVELIDELSHYIIDSGGKRLRPVLVLLAAKACHYEGNGHIPIAAIVEFIHTATLLHDDVIDHSALRRGKQTAHLIWGSEASVLVGDFLYSRAFQMMVVLQEKNLEVMRIMADTTNTIAEGEVMQLINRHNHEISELDYLKVIYHKTAKLFEAASELGAVLGNRSATEINAMAEYGHHLGKAFQLVDDALDFCGSVDEIGKNVGDDLADGKPTLPLIYLLRSGTPAQKTLVELALTAGDREKMPAIVEAVSTSGAIDYTLNAAKVESDIAMTALQAIPDSIYRQALIDLAIFAVERRY